jgi:hypothetical protein
VLIPRAQYPLPGSLSMAMPLTHSWPVAPQDQQSLPPPTVATVRANTLRFIWPPQVRWYYAHTIRSKGGHSPWRDVEVEGAGSL